MLTAERARELLNYDPATGVFTWKERTKQMFNARFPDRAVSVWNARFAGKEAGVVSCGYFILVIDYKHYPAHRVAWLMMTGAWPKHFIDHIDMNGLNNKFSNLREATKAQNMQNRGPQSNNKTGIKGVRWDASRGKFAWECRGHGVRIRGRCDTLEEAVACHRKASTELHGEFWRAA
jgi:hypothetical protein